MRCEVMGFFVLWLKEAKGSYCFGGWRVGRIRSITKGGDF